jgi:hypothetical protein
LNLNGANLFQLDKERLINSSSVKAYCLILPSYQNFKGGPEATKASKSSLKIFQLPFIFDPKKSNIIFIMYDFYLVIRQDFIKVRLDANKPDGQNRVAR